MASKTTLTTAQLIAAARKIVGDKMTKEAVEAKIVDGKIRSMKKVEEVFTKIANQGTRGVRTDRVIEPGPKGFRFHSKAWKESVKTQHGIAVHPTYLPKLKAHAKAVGVSSAGNDPKAIAERIAAVL